MVLHFLRRDNETGIMRLRIGLLLNERLALLQKALHAFAFFPFGVSPGKPQHLLHPGDMPLGFQKLGFECRFQIRMGGRIGQQSQCRDQLRLRAEEILEFVDIENLQSVEFHGEICCRGCAHIRRHPARHPQRENVITVMKLRSM